MLSKLKYYVCVMKTSSPNITTEHTLCGWSIKLVRYSNNPDVRVVYEHCNKNMYHKQNIFENKKKRILQAEIKKKLRVYARSTPQQMFASNCKSSSNLVAGNSEA